jgi:hypothetical protein
MRMRQFVVFLRLIRQAVSSVFFMGNRIYCPIARLMTTVAYKVYSGEPKWKFLTFNI